MEITIRKEGQTAKVSVSGDLDIYHAAEAKGRLMAAFEGAGDAELDLSGVAGFDSAGLQLLLLVRREKERAGGRLSLTATSGAVDGVIGLFNLGEMFGPVSRREA